MQLTPADDNHIIIANMVNLPSCQCKRCKHKWYLRSPKRPKFCPKCHSPYWDKERIRK